MATGSAIGPDELKIAHIWKVHLLIVDSGPEDFNHVHPEPTTIVGDWSFTFIPKYNRSYRVWVAVVRADNGTLEYVPVDRTLGTKMSLT